ncbi:hypothetical protein NPIL_164141 [Nephila pilipes]|uniref:SWIM-type domain-containing protein n=1 Tax=Nephila pilipes TaxID=299642 RepID=A0A8X6TB05_NEPPI|nr:hypothetical protein NPIL_164141 [Nephila pilipes]
MEPAPPDSEILNARCTCPAGRAPAFCKHTFALLHAIDDYIRKGMYTVPSERLQTWDQPKPTKKDSTMATQLFKCKCTEASSPDSNKFAFEEVTDLGKSEYIRKQMLKLEKITSEKIKPSILLGVQILGYRQQLNLSALDGLADLWSLEIIRIYQEDDKTDNLLDEETQKHFTETIKNDITGRYQVTQSGR